MSSATSRKIEEPTMEDILSSIRRIIADDQKAARAIEEQEIAPAVAAKAGSDTSIEADIAALRSALDAIRGEVGPLQDDTYEPTEDVGMSEDEITLQPGDALLSREAEEIVRKSFGDLEDAVSQYKERSLDDMAREMLRPMLKSWLEENLPPLVERLVREEIKRLVNLQD